ncbi:MAG: hypothetical protein COB07_04315 [Sulfurovum sp.]|nr:MAG: hypothetical protein COB07_04315 [Sulfurovum sp.]
MTAPLNRHAQAHLIDMVKEKLLLERIVLNNVDVNPRDMEGRNALYWAIKNKSIYNANLLIVFGSSLVVAKNTHALFHAIACKNHAMVVLLIDKGLDVNFIDEKGKTALMYAIEAEVVDTVKFLIKKGADIYLMDDEFNMAENYAKSTNSNIIKSYLQHLIYIDMQEASCSQNKCNCG